MKRYVNPILEVTLDRIIAALAEDSVAGGYSTSEMCLLAIAAAVLRDSILDDRMRAADLN